MPGAIRTDEKSAKILYKIKNTPKDQQQKFRNEDNHNYPGKKRIKNWSKESREAQ